MRRLRVACAAITLAWTATLAWADAPRRPPRRVEVVSPSGLYLAVSDPESGSTEVRPTDGKGESWKLDGYFSVLAVADDGRHLAIGYEGGNLVPTDVSRDLVLVRFFDRGHLTAKITFGDLFSDARKIPETASHRHWGHMDGFDTQNSFWLELFEGTRRAFDPTTGAAIPSAKD